MLGKLSKSGCCDDDGPHHLSLATGHGEQPLVLGDRKDVGVFAVPSPGGEGIENSLRPAIEQLICSSVRKICPCKQENLSSWLSDSFKISSGICTCVLVRRQITSAGDFGSAELF